MGWNLLNLGRKGHTSRTGGARLYAKNLRLVVLIVSRPPFAAHHATRNAILFVEVHRIVLVPYVLMAGSIANLLWFLFGLNNIFPLNINKVVISVILYPPNTKLISGDILAIKFINPPFNIFVF